VPEGGFASERKLPPHHLRRVLEIFYVRVLSCSGGVNLSFLEEDVEVFDDFGDGNDLMRFV